MERSRRAQVILATHSPLLMAYPGAKLLHMTRYAPEPTMVEETEHFRLLAEFCAAPHVFVQAVVA